MTEIKAIDGLILRPKALGKSKEKAVEAEKAIGKGGLLQLFPESADRQKDMTPEELVAEMDKAGVEKGLLNIRRPEDLEWVMEAIKKYPGKFIFCGVRFYPITQGIMNELRRLKDLMNKCPFQSIRVAGWELGVPCTDSRLFPFYTFAIEHDLKVSIPIGYPGPAGLARNQDPLYVDEICYLFPELKVIQSHPGHPWTDVAIQNVIKYPNCYLKTNAFRPKYLPPELIQNLNTRAQDKIIWASEYPLISFKDSLDDVRNLPIREPVRRKYLRDNLLRLFKFE